MTCSKPKLIVHDVLQDGRFSGSQLKAIEEKSFFEWFKEFMTPLENEKVTLACVAHGVGNSEWVKYILDHPLWEVQFHGLTHADYSHMSVSEMISDFDKGIRLLEVFGRPTEFYAPRHKYNERTKEVAKGFGMELVDERRLPKDYIESGAERIYAHFWSSRHVERIKEIYDTSKK